MKAIVLAAGKPILSNDPIAEVDIGGSRLLDLQIHCLRQNHVAHIKVVCGYQAQTMERHRVEVIYNEHWAKQGSVGSLKRALDEVDDDEDVLVLYGDIVFTPEVVSRLIGAHGDIAAVCFLDRSNRDLTDRQEFAFVEDGVICSVKSQSAGTGVRTVFAGMVRFRKRNLQVVRQMLAESVVPDTAHLGEVLNMLSSRGIDVIPVMIEDGWIEIRGPADLEALQSWPALQPVLEPLQTNWASRATGYNKLNWVNDDKLLMSMINRALVSRPERILDVGTGTGKILVGLKSALGQAGAGAEFWGVDSSMDMLAKVPSDHGFRLMVDDAEKLSLLPDEYFDLVTARMVFHHVHDIVLAGRRVFQKLRRSGQFIICEGVPPTQRSVEWYTDMFRLKEDRHTLPEGDLINVMVQAGFQNIVTDTVVMPSASLNNWLDNSGIGQSSIDMIKRLHYEAPSFIKDDYNMEFRDGDCFMTWRFAVVCSTKPPA